MQIDEIIAIKTSNGGTSSKRSKAGMFDDALKSCEEDESVKSKDSKGDDNGSIVQLMAACGTVIPNVQTPENNTSGGQLSQENAEDGTVSTLENAPSTAESTQDTALFGLLQYSQRSMVITNTPVQQSNEAASDTPVKPQADTENAQTKNEIVSSFTSINTASNAGQDNQKQIGSFSVQLHTVLNNALSKSTETALPVQQNFQMAQDGFSGEPESAVSTEPVVSKMQTQNDTIDDIMYQIDAITDVNEQSNAASTTQTAVSDDFSAQLDSVSVNASQSSGDILQEQPVKADIITVDEKPLKTTDEVQTDAAVQTFGNATTVKTEEPQQSGSKESGAEQSSDDQSSFDMSRLVFGTSQSFEVNDAQSADQTIKAEVMNQISDAVKQASDNGRTEMKIHLSPEELGGISIKIVSQNGELTLQITADNQKTGQLLVSSMHELTESMQNQGITMSKAEVTYTNSSGFDAATSQQQNQNQQNADYSLPKWTVAMETGGAVDSSDTAQPETVENMSSSGMSILA